MGLSVKSTMWAKTIMSMPEICCNRVENLVFGQILSILERRGLYSKSVCTVERPTSITSLVTTKLRTRILVAIKSQLYPNGRLQIVCNCDLHAMYIGIYCISLLMKCRSMTQIPYMRTNIIYFK